MAEITSRPFTIDVPEAEIADLRERLARTRWPEAEPVSDWSQGTPLAYLREVVETRSTDYDGRDLESRLNAYDQQLAAVDGLDIHLLHVRSPEASARPLIMTHGWPGSVVELLKVIGPLTGPVAHGGDAADAFHLVVPSLPGYGFSERPAETGWGLERIAAAWVRIMHGPGYERFFAHGGDWGALVTHVLGVWTVSDGHPGNVLSRREMLDNVSVCWFTQTATSSARLYWESFASVLTSFDALQAPVAYSMFAGDLVTFSERWARTRYPDLRYSGTPAKGGHFAAFEQPELFVEEVRAGLRGLR